MSAPTPAARKTAGLSETIRSIAWALVVAGLIRTFAFQPFFIPSSSMEPTLLVGDFLFVSKFSYGYSRYSLPFSFPLFSGRILATRPRRGDVAVFRPPEHASTDYIKRIIGMPGDRIQLIDGVIYINGTPVERKPVNDFGGTNPCGGESDPRILARVTQWRETLPDGVSYDTLECRAINGFPDTTPVYMVPPGHYFMMGDDRENSEDSRFSDVGYIPFENIVGRADIIFFSIKRGHIWEIWRWPWSVRWNRLLRTIH